jgi:hypothetical protein
MCHFDSPRAEVLILTYPIRWFAMTEPAEDCFINAINAVFEIGISETNIRDTVTWDIEATQPISGCCLKCGLELSRSVHHWDERNRLLSPENGIGLAIEVVE